MYGIRNSESTEVSLQKINTFNARKLALQNSCNNYSKMFKGTVGVITSDPPLVEGCVGFTQTTLKPLTDEG